MLTSLQQQEVHANESCLEEIGQTFKVTLGKHGYIRWRIQNGLYKRLQDVPVSWRRGETWERFDTVTTMVHVKSFTAHGMEFA
jgi:hypothetical protein